MRNFERSWCMNSPQSLGTLHIIFLDESLANVTPTLILARGRHSWRHTIYMWKILHKQKQDQCKREKQSNVKYTCNKKNFAFCTKRTWSNPIALGSRKSSWLEWLPLLNRSHLAEIPHQQQQQQEEKVKWSDKIMQWWKWSDKIMQWWLFNYSPMFVTYGQRPCCFLQFFRLTKLPRSLAGRPFAI